MDFTLVIKYICLTLHKLYHFEGNMHLYKTYFSKISAITKRIICNGGSLERKEDRLKVSSFSVWQNTSRRNDKLEIFLSVLVLHIHIC